MRAVPALILALLMATPALPQEAETPPVDQAPVDQAPVDDAPADDAAPVDDPPEAVVIVEPEPPQLLFIDAADTTLEEHLWSSRPIVVFADTPRDPRFQDQLDLLAARAGPLIERDVVVIFDADPDARNSVRLALRPRGFSLVVVQRDGHVAFRKPNPWDVREITRAIDNLPMRIEEMGLSQ